MKPDFRSVRWTPRAVSWVSFVIMGLVIAGVGLNGTGYVVDYLKMRIKDHGMEHNREIAQRLRPQLELRLTGQSGNDSTALQDLARPHGTFGYRLFMITLEGHLIADSHGPSRITKHYLESWLDDLASLAPTAETAGLAAGPWEATAEDARPMLVWLEPLQTGSWLGVASGQQDLVDFFDELYWHLIAVMLATYTVIGIFGVYAMRGVGRAYEQMLEAQVRDRTLALQAAHEEILGKTRLATIGQTASVLAHEMRNPLASIKLALSGIGVSQEIPARTRRRIALVAGEVDRLDGLLSQTLDYARPVRLSDTPLALQDIVVRVIEEQQPLLVARHLVLCQSVAADCAPIPLDADKMHQAILNIMKNAIEASPDGGKIGVTLSCEGADGIVVEVANSGEPMTPDGLARAFEPFYTSKPHGSGLGLGLIRRIIEEHGGNVTLVSDAERGTRLSIRLPY